jgi:hypothetical protein
MAPKRKHNNSQPSSTAEGTSQKRQKKLLQRKEVVEKMEEIMHLINAAMPEDFAMLSGGISKIPRTLVEDIVSPETVETQLARFKDFCQTSLDAIAIELDIGPPADLTREAVNQSRFIRRLISLVHL